MAEFGGHWFWEPTFGIGTLQLSFDLRALDVERVVELFIAAAQDLGAFFAAAQVDPGYEIVEGEPSMTRLTPGTETFLDERARLAWAPPAPMWLSWFGEPYRELVAEHLLGAPEVRGVGRGLFVRMSDEPAPMAELGDWLLPSGTHLPVSAALHANPRWLDQIQPAATRRRSRKDPAAGTAGVTSVVQPTLDRLLLGIW